MTKPWPRRWVAVLLALFVQPLAFVYLARWRLALLWTSILFGSVFAARAFSDDKFIQDLVVTCLVLLCVGYVLWLTSRKRLIEQQTAQSRPAYSRWYGLVLIPVVIFVPWLMVRAFVVDVYRIPSSAMAPTLPLGKTFWVQKWGWGNYGLFSWKFLKTQNTAHVRRGDLVVFEFPKDPSKDFVMRVVGLPGDKLEVAESLLTLNGQRVTQETGQTMVEPSRGIELRLFNEELDGRRYQVGLTLDRRQTQPATVVVPQDQYFVLGDNRDNSLDSRYWGFVPRENFVGRVLGHNK
jgi:signal peptidase I